MSSTIACPSWCTKDHGALTRDRGIEYEDQLHGQTIVEADFWTLEINDCGDLLPDGTHAPALGMSIGDDFTPTEARALARDLLHAADLLEQILRSGLGLAPAASR